MNAQRVISVLVWLVFCGCPASKTNVPCGADSDCDLRSAGACLVLEHTGRGWCAYPDPECPGGYRYSEDGVGDSFAGFCAGSATDTRQFLLTVHVGGNGGGAVQSDPVGIDCTNGDQASCSALFATGTVVTLSQSAARGSFLGWSDDCRGSAGCVVTVSEPLTVGALFGFPGEALWFNHISGSGRDTGRRIQATPTGELLATGTYTGSVMIGGAALASAGGRDAYLAKLNPATGAAIWAVSIGGTDNDEGLATAVSTTGEVYVTGVFAGTLRVGADTLVSAGLNDIFVVKLSAAGNVIWARRFGGADYDRPEAIDARGSQVALAGTFRGSLMVGTQLLTSNGPADDVFVAKLEANGDPTWARSFGGTYIDLPRAVRIDSSGHVVVAGGFSETANFGGGAVTSAGALDVYVVKYASANGAFLFGKTFGSAVNNDSATDLSLAANDDIVIVGGFFGSVDVGGPSALTSSSQEDIYVVRYTQAGAHLWSKSFGGTGSEAASAIALNSGGSLAIAGGFCGTLAFGGPTVTAAGDCTTRDVFAVRLNATDGSYINLVRHGGTANENAQGVAETEDGRFFVTGEFEGFAEFGGEAYTSVGGYDAFVVAMEAL